MYSFIDTLRGACCIAVCVCLCACDGVVRENAQVVPQRKSEFVLGRSTPLPPAKYDLAQLSNLFPAFMLRPSPEEYSQLVMPFKGGPTEDEQLKAYAFSFLLSNALDWGPGSYCSRHAYFTFQRSQSLALEAGNSLRPDAIASYAGKWDATHVFGGEIVAVSNGYTGTLKIYSPDGRLQHQKEFGIPCRYFDLLGNMSAEALRHLGYSPSSNLVNHLKIPRCKNEKLLIELGRAAFASERSGAEFGIYRDILKQEPGFAEVRYWYANQSLWVDGDRDAYDGALAQSLRDYVTRVALEDIELSSAETSPTAFGYNYLIGELERLTGTATPYGWILRFKADRSRRMASTLSQARDATEVAAQYPNNFKLLSCLVGNEAGNKDGIWNGDFSMIASLALAEMRCQYLPSSLAERTAAYHFAMAAREVGYPEISAEMLFPMYQGVGPGNKNDITAYGWRLAEVLQDMGQYDDSFQVGLRAAKACNDDNSAFYFLNAFISGFLAGREREVELLAKQYDQTFAAKPFVHCLLQAYRALAKGDHAAVSAYFRTEPIGAEDLRIRVFMDRLILCAESDLMQAKSEYRAQVKQGVCMNPGLRPLWILLDAYDQKDPRPEDEGFYEVLAWQHPNDPWVEAAVKARSRRMPNPHKFDLVAVLDTLTNYPAIRWPVDRGCTIAGGYPGLFVSPPSWDYTLAVKRLLEMREYDRADELTRQCCGAAILGPDNLLTHFRHLYYLVQDARMKDKRPIKTRTIPSPYFPVPIP